jgi:hypothetical protein
MPDEPERIAAILERQADEHAELVERIRDNCCPITGLPGPSGVTLEEHVEMICAEIERAQQTTIREGRHWTTRL